MPGLKSIYKVLAKKAKQSISVGTPADFEGNAVSMVSWSTSLSGVEWVTYRNNSGEIIFDIQTPLDSEGTDFDISFTLQDNSKD